ncbi:MAG: hypothetical protein ACP5KN_06655, partial [Armatimonadota bacterium]
IEQAQKALRALQGGGRRSAPSSQSESEELAQEPATPGAAEPPAGPRRPFHPRTTMPGLLGQSGLLRTPAADTPAGGSAALSASTFSDGDRVLSATLSPDDATEITAGLTSGGQPDAVLLSAKREIYRSDDARTRAAVGVLDATDEIDTTAYGVVSQDVGSRRLATTVSAGIGGGDLLDGLFLGGAVPVDDRTTALAEWLDIGDDDDLSIGLSWRASDRFNLKAGVVDGDLAGNVSLDTRF